MPVQSDLTDRVTIEGADVVHHLVYPGDKLHYQGRTTVENFATSLVEKMGYTKEWSSGLLPSDLVVRGVHSRNGISVFLVEVAPGTRTIPWLRDDSPTQFGPRATYRDVYLALPWQYFFVAFQSDGNMAPSSSVFFRNSPLHLLTDTLYDPHFYNCSCLPNPQNVYCWICTEQYPIYLEPVPFSQALQSFMQWFWFAGFNASSEYHEGNSFWGKNRLTIRDPRVKRLSLWEKASKESPAFALTVPWLDSGHTPVTIYEQLTKGEALWRPTSSKELANVVDMS